LGMKHTVALEAGKSNVADRAMGHSRLADAWQLTDQSITSAVLGDGGIYTNVLDYARWIKALLSHRFISDSLQKVAWQKARLKNGNSVNYGYGWHVDEIRGKSYPHHSGSSIGFRNHILLFPDKERAVVILTNRNEGNPYELALQITDLVWPVTAD
ncbi:MAG: serine hydrolase domain-containing protein, partial [Bacteroidota bacterium]